MNRISLVLGLLAVTASLALAAPHNAFIAMKAADDGAAALNANESSAPVEMSNAEKATFAAQGTFGSGTMTLQITPDGTNWSSSGLTLTAAGNVQLTTPCKQARWTLSGATTPSVTMAVAIRTLN